MDNNKPTGNPALYDCRDVSKILKVNERYARIIMVQPQFPSFKVGAKILVRVKDFNDWFDSLAGKEIQVDQNLNKFKTNKEIKNPPKK